MDDFLIYSANVEFHVKHLQEVFCRLRKADLTLRGHKCCIGKHELKYLGHVFSAKRTLPNEDKIEVVRNWAIPNDVTELRRFLGIASYYRRYIHHFADIAGPLHQLTHK